MKVYELKREQVLPLSQDEAWKFFSTPLNLATITPPELDFKVLSKLDGKPIYSGMIISYIVRPLFKIPLRWKTEIKDVLAPNKFVDTQLRGPYRLWEHTHIFKPVEGGVHMTDIVKYALPLGPLGTIAHSLVVKQQLKRIFDFREQKLRELFN